MSILYPVLLSLSPHKEFRFLLPSLPGLHLAAAYCGLQLFRDKRVRQGVYVLCFVVGCHVLAALYFCIYHQAGAECAFQGLGDLLNEAALAFNGTEYIATNVVSVLLLAPCHAFPGYAFLPVFPSQIDTDQESIRHISNVELIFPDCSPDLQGMSESERLQQLGPTSYLHEVISYRARNQQGGKHQRFMLCLSSI